MQNYHELSLIELKHIAKNHTPKIKQYYIKSRAELIQLLTMKTFTQEMVNQKKTLAELRKEAQERKLPGIWKLRRAELLEVLYPSTKQDNQNNNDGKTHNEPEDSKSKNVRVDVGKDL